MNTIHYSNKIFPHRCILGIMLMVGLLFTACSSDEDTVPPTQGYSMSLQAVKVNEPGQRALALNGEGNAITTSWTAGDIVEVWSSTVETKLGTLTAQNDGTTTLLTGTLTLAPEVGTMLRLKYNSDSYTEQDGTLTGSNTSIDKTCDCALAGVEVASVDNGKITTTGTASFTTQQTIVKFTLKNKAGTEELSAQKLYIIADGLKYTITPPTARSEFFVALPFLSSSVITLNAEVGDSKYTYYKTNVSFDRNTYYRINVKMTQLNMDIKMNPLYYVAPYNMLYNLNTKSMASTDNAGSYVKWDDQLPYFSEHNAPYDGYKSGGRKFNGAYYHLPSLSEWYSIVPADHNNNSSNLLDYTGLKENFITPIWAYNSTTKAGISETSYWVEHVGTGNRVTHAIRFLGTPYCSAWKYEMHDLVKNGNGYMTVSATLIGEMPKEDAEKWYNNNFSYITFGNDASNFAQQRVFYGLGYHPAGSSVDKKGSNGYYWSCTDYNSQYRALTFSANTVTMSNYNYDNGFICRLFLDN